MKAMPISPAEYRQYVKEVNAAAGTDIRILERGWMDAVKAEDWDQARRLEGIVLEARRVAGYRTPGR